MTLTAFNRRRRELAAQQAEAAQAEAEKPTPGPADTPPTPLERLTKAELLTVAKHNDVTVAASATKAEIIAALLEDPAAENETE